MSLGWIGQWHGINQPWAGEMVIFDRQAYQNECLKDGFSSVWSERN
jgi:hypothetical protein